MSKKRSPKKAVTVNPMGAKSLAQDRATLRDRRDALALLLGMLSADVFSIHDVRSAYRARSGVLARLNGDNFAPFAYCALHTELCRIVPMCTTCPLYCARGVGHDDTLVCAHPDFRIDGAAFSQQTFVGQYRQALADFERVLADATATHESIRPSFAKLLRAFISLVRAWRVVTWDILMAELAKAS